VPVPVVWAGSALILGSGVFVFIRERMQSRRVAATPVQGRQ
jgi:S-adenosylmethionine uptake transporter